MPDKVKIRTLRTIKPPDMGGASIGPGIVITLPDTAAKRYIDRGEAEPVTRVSEPGAVATGSNASPTTSQHEHTQPQRHEPHQDEHR